MFYVETHVFYKDADGIKSESVQKHPVDPALSSGKNAFDHWKMILEISKRQGKIDSGTVMLKNEYDDNYHPSRQFLQLIQQLRKLHHDMDST